MSSMLRSEERPQLYWVISSPPQPGVQDVDEGDKPTSRQTPAASTVLSSTEALCSPLRKMGC